MPKGKHSGGPGTYMQNSVNCTMDAPFAKAMNQKSGSGGTMDRNKAPFDKPHDTGGGGIPLVFYDDMSSSVGTRAPAPGQTAPSQQGNKRPGTKEYPFGGKTRDGN